VVARREIYSIPSRISIAIESVILPDGRKVDDYMQIQIADFVMIFAETASGHAVCLRLYRHGARCVGLELPAGHIDHAEDPLDAARRELLEETGYESADWQALGAVFQSTNHRIGLGYVFHARNAVRVQAPCSGDLEDAQVELYSRQDLIAVLHRREVVSASCLAALALVLI
jgi:ADP-ribose pyrophosphatase